MNNSTNCIPQETGIPNVMMAETPSLAEKCAAAGYNFELDMHDGVVYPTLVIGNVRTMKNRKSRKDDIFLCSYQKSGTHWVWEILNMIVAGKAEYHKHWQNCSWLEYRTQEELEELESTRILHTHLLPSMLPELSWQQRCKMVYVQRNPKDVVVSFHNQSTKQIWKDNPVQKPSFTGTFEDMVGMFLEGALPFGSWFEHVNEWKHVTHAYPNIVVCYIQYEDMIEDCVREIKKMAEYLERPLPDKVYSEIAEACSFHNLKHVSENVKDQTYHNKYSDESDGYFRKGIVGDWKNWFTVAQSERLERVYEEKLKQKFSF